MLCAVSGGLDSMCLLHFLTTWGPGRGFCAAAAHFNHGLRGQAADRDQQFVENWCAQQRIPCFTGSGDTRGLMEREGLSLEEAARKLRYAFLRREAEKLGQHIKIYTAHHADDNAETLLLHLARGTGLDGLTGIPPVRGILIRPLLATPRIDIAVYLAQEEIPHVEDSSNRDESFSRNRLRWQVVPELRCALAELRALCAALEDQGQTGNLKLDLSLVNDMEYYNGLVFQGYLAGSPRAVLRGGQYDPLAEQFRPGARAIGYGLYLSELDRLSQPESGKTVMLNVALPKGRLGDKVYDLLAGVGYGCPESYSDTRKLVVENPAAGIRYFLVKPSDVAIYVEHGAADIGIVGKDILAESGADVYELLDTGLGKCRMCVAGPKDFTEDQSRALRVATKFVNIAKRYYAAQGRDIDIIKLNGSIELAPILGLSDVIVDIVETGTTLRENDLKVLTEFMPISARFIANRASYQFKRPQIDKLLRRLTEVTES